MDGPSEMPRSAIITSAALVVGAAIHCSFFLDYSSWSWIPAMWPTQICLFLPSLGGVFVLTTVCAHLGRSKTATTRSFLATIRIPLTLWLSPKHQPLVFGVRVR